MATILPTFGEVYALHARLHRMVSMYRHRKDTAGTFARRLERELPHLKRNVFQTYNKGVSCQDIAKDNGIGVASVERYYH